MSRKREKKQEEEIDEHAPMPNVGNPFFDRIARAALDGECSVEHLLEICTKYGKLHGEAIRKKVESSTSYSKVYSNSRRARGQQSEPQAPTEETNSSRSVVGGRNPYNHPFYRMYHNGKTSGVSSKTQDANPPSKRARTTGASSSTPTTAVSPSSRGIAGLDSVHEEAENDIQSTATSIESKPVIRPVEGMRGVEGLFDKGDPSTALYANRFVAFLTLMGRRIDLGEFPRDREAALAHDRALMRALGPARCPQDQLNFPISSYAHDPLDSFMRYDTILKRALTGTSWDGLKDCDFGFLLTQSFYNKNSPKKRKNGNGIVSTPSIGVSHTSLRASTRATSISSSSTSLETTEDERISYNLQYNLKTPAGSTKTALDEDLYFK